MWSGAVEIHAIATAIGTPSSSDQQCHQLDGGVAVPLASGEYYLVDSQCMVESQTLLARFGFQAKWEQGALRQGIVILNGRPGTAVTLAFLACALPKLVAPALRRLFD